MKKYAVIVLALATMAGPVASDSLEIPEDILRRINQIRQKQGLAPLVSDPRLEQVARLHSQEMLRAGRLAHELSGSMCGSVKSRLHRAQVFCLSFGENLLECSDHPPAEMAEMAVSSWLESPSHRKNVLERKFNRTGVGVAQDSQGNAYFTQLFSQEHIHIQNLQIVPGPAGYRVTFRGVVLQGQPRGRIYFDGKPRADWNADATGGFLVDLEVETPGALEVAQQISEREWSIDIAIPVEAPSPEESGGSSKRQPQSK